MAQEPDRELRLMAGQEAEELREELSARKKS